MTTRADDKTVLVTGASRGIGAAIAKQLAAIGQLFAPMLEEGMHSIEESARFIETHQV